MISAIRLESLNTMTDVRDAFQVIRDALAELALLKGEFELFEIPITGAVTNLKYTHNLKFTPTDIIQTSLTGVGALTWNYDLFTKTTLDITTTGACVVRAYIGRHREGSDL